MNLTKEQREIVLNNFKRFIADIKAYDILTDIKVYLDIRYSSKNNRYDYIYIYKDKKQDIFALGDKVNDILEHIAELQEKNMYNPYDYNKILDIMSNKNKIFNELEKENNKNKEILNDILNY